VRRSITQLLTTSRMCVVLDHGWHEKLSQSLGQTYATVKVGDGNGNGQWRSFTIVLTGYENVGA
jgi:hypothetical protein